MSHRREVRSDQRESIIPNAFMTWREGVHVATVYTVYDLGRVEILRD